MGNRGRRNEAANRDLSSSAVGAVIGRPRMRSMHRLRSANDPIARICLTANVALRVTRAANDRPYAVVCNCSTNPNFRDVGAPSPTAKKDARREGKVDTSGINEKKLDAAQRAQVELGKAIAKALGVDVVFYESKAKEGVYRGAQGAYQDGVIRLDVNAGRNFVRDANSGILKTLSHEITHFVRDYSPELYSKLEAFAMDVLAEESSVDALIADKQARYERNHPGRTMSRELAREELTADACELMLRDSETVRRLVRENRTLAEKIADFVRDFVDRLRAVFGDSDRVETRAVMKHAEQLQKLWDDALAEAVEAHNVIGNEKTADEGGAQFQDREVNGKHIVWIENSSLTNKQLQDYQAVADYIANHIGECFTILESGQKVYIGDDLPDEYTQSKYTKHLLNAYPSVLRAKNKAVDGLGEMIEIATNRRWEKTTHTQNKDAKYGMYRYDASFAFPTKDNTGKTTKVNAYDVELLIRNASDGKKYLYDIVNIKRNTADALDLQQRETRSGGQAARQSSVSDNNIAYTSEKAILPSK